MDDKSYNLVTHITVDSVDARRSMNEMKRGIRNMNQEWRANYHAQISAGHSTDALIAKSRGLKEMETSLAYTVNQLKHALNNSADQRGNRKYRDTVLDLQRMEMQLGKTKSQVTNVSRALVLHNEKLRQAEQIMRSNQETGRESIQVYRDQGDAINESRQKATYYQQRLNDLTRTEKVLHETINEANNQGLAGNRGYSHLLVELRRVQDEYAKVKATKQDFDSGLTQSSKYNDLYNQSTNKLVESLDHLKRHAEANRIEFNRLSQNIGNESQVLQLEAQKANKIADISGKDSLAFQREQSKLNSLTATYDDHQHKISELGQTYGKMDRTMTASVDKQSSKIHELNLSSHKYLSTAHSLAGASFALGAGFIYGTKQAVGLENEFIKVRNLIQAGGESATKANGEMRSMEKSSVDLSLQYGKSQRTIADGFETLVRRGYDGKQALASQKYFLQGAIASGDQYNDVVHTAASTLEGFGMRSQNTAKMVNASKQSVNELAYAADLTATDFKGLGYSMAYVAQPAHQAHQSMAETSATLGELSNQGESASQSATGLRRILINLATIKGSRNNKALQTLGLAPKDLIDAQGNLKSLTSIFMLLRSRMKGMGSAQQATIFKQLFGMYGYTSAQGIMASLDKINGLKNKVAQAPHMDHGKGYAAWIGRKNMDSTENQLKRLRQAGNELAITYSQGLNPVFKRFAGFALGASKGLNGLPKSLKDMVVIGTTLVPVLAGVSFGLAAIKKTYATFYDIRQRGFMLWLKNKDATDQQTNALNSNNEAQEKANELKQQNNDLDNQQNTDLHNDANAEDEDTTATERYDAVDRRLAAAPNNLMTGAKSSLKTAGAAGLAIGGTEAATGDVAGGAEDGIGTSVGTIAGGALGTALPFVTPGVGMAVGGIVGPMLARSVGRALSSTARKQPVMKASQDQYHTKSFNNALHGISNSSQKFVRTEASLESNATQSLVSSRNKMTSSIRADYNKMSSLAIQYGKNELKTKESNLSKLHKQGLLSSKNYQKDLNQAHKKESSTVKDIQRIHHRLLTSDVKNAERRKKDLDSLNKDILSLTNAGYKKQKALVKSLDSDTTRLSEKSYTKIMRLRNKNYRNSIDIAEHKYNNQKRSLNKDLATASQYNKKTYDQVKRRVSKREQKDYEEEQNSISAARKEKNKVTDLANKRASNQIQTTYKANREIKNSNANLVSDLGKLWKGIASTFSHIGSAHVSARHPGGTTARANGTPDTQALHLAVGNLPGISQNENAVVNDGGGRELIKMPNGQLVLPSGRNVHTILPKGTSVFNALQTHRLLTAIGAMSSPLQHHASGTDDTNTGYAGFAFGNSDDSDKKGFNIDSMKGNVKDAKKAANDIHDVIDKGYQDTSDAANKHLQDLHDNSDSLWNDTRKLTKKHVKDIHDDTNNRTKNIRDLVDKYEKQTESWSNSHLDKTVRYFQRHFNMIPPITSSSMKAGIRNINSGISGIDRVLAEFGGNSHVLSMVHYASGTSGPSMQKQLAMVNDATSGPTQEAIVSDNGRVRMPRGRNVLTALNPGDKVLNGSDTLRALRTGLIPHYANGLKSSDALRALAKRYAKTPSSFTNSTFNRLAAVIGTVMSKGLTEATKQGAQTPANNWSNAMWKYIDTLINPDNSALLNEAHKLAAGHNKYVWGATGPDAYDCGGLVMAALHHLGIPAPHTHMVRVFPKIPASQATTGDIVESATHLGIVADPHHSTYFSAFSKSAHPNILTQPLDNLHFTPGHPYYFLRVPQLEHRNSEYQEVKNNPLTPLVKRELGSKASQWISANLSDNAAAGLAGGNGAVAQAWNEFSKLGMSDTQIEGVLGGSKQESGFNPSAVSGDGGYGLFQITPSASGVNLKAFANEHGKSWTNPAVQALCYYEKFLKPSGYLTTHGSLEHEAEEAASVEAHSAINAGFSSTTNFANRLAGAHEIADWFSKHHGKGYATGGLSVSDKLAHISEGNKPEMVLPLTNRSRAVELMLKSLQYMFGNMPKQNNNNNSVDNQQERQLQREQLQQDHRFEQELIQSNRNKDTLIQNILNKMTVLINTVREKPVLSKSNIYKANRDVSMKKLRLRNLNRGTF